MKPVTRLLARRLDKLLATSSPTLADPRQMAKFRTALKFYLLAVMSTYSRNQDLAALIPLGVRQDAAIVKVLTETNTSGSVELVASLRASADPIYASTRGSLS